MKRDSSVKWVQMNFDVPTEIIKGEYENVKEHLIIHRPEDGHKDWKAITLYGVGSGYTNSHWEYGFKAKKELTEIGQMCPHTMSFVSSLPFSRIDDVRFLVIEPNGFIKEHIDVPDRNWLEPLNISITYPVGSKFWMEGKEVPYDVGKSFVLNIHYSHGVENNSDEQRLHLLVHGKKNKDFYNNAISQRM